jgi:hypothetical protein
MEYIVHKHIIALTQLSEYYVLFTGTHVPQYEEGNALLLFHALNTQCDP